MRRTRFALGVSAAVLLGAVVLPGLAAAEPASPAQPADAGSVGIQADLCQSKLTYSGYVHIYDITGCDSSPICSLVGNDEDYGNGVGCANGDDNKASSLLNNGYSGGHDDVRFYRGTHHSAASGSICIANHRYASNLADWTFSNGAGTANNQISSHQWVTSC